MVAMSPTALDIPLDDSPAPGGAQAPDCMPITLDALADARERLNTYHRQLKSWRKVGHHFGLPKSTAYAIARRGYTPKDRATLRKLEASLAMTIETGVVTRTRDRKGRFANPRHE